MVTAARSGWLLIRMCASGSTPRTIREVTWAGFGESAMRQARDSAFFKMSERTIVRLLAEVNSSVAHSVNCLSVETVFRSVRGWIVHLALALRCGNSWEDSRERVQKGGALGLNSRMKFPKAGF